MTNLCNIRHDVTVRIRKDSKVNVTVYTLGDDPSFEMLFDSIENVKEWQEYIAEEIKEGEGQKKQEDIGDEKLKTILNKYPI